MSEDIRETGAIVYPEACLSIYSIEQYAKDAEICLKAGDIEGVCLCASNIFTDTTRLLAKLLNLDERNTLKFQLDINKAVMKRMNKHI